MNNNLKNLLLSFLLIGLASFLVSCNDDIDEPMEEEAIVRFERNTNLSWGRAHVGLLSKIDDRLFYSNINNPGFFDAEGRQNQFAFRSFDMRFGHVFTKYFTVGVSDNRRSLLIIPNINYASNRTISLGEGRIPELTPDFLLVPGWSEVPNFSLNDNFLISSWENANPRENVNVFILELNAVDNNLGEGGKIVSFTEPILNKIPIDYTIDGFRMSQLISAFPFEDGWIVSADIAGLQPAFFVEKNGNVTPLFSDNRRFAIFGLQQSESGELFVANENGFYFSPSGNPTELNQIASVNATLRFKLIDDRLVVWAGTDSLFELKDFKNPDNIRLVELENEGLQGLLVKDVELFQGEFYVATNAGLFLKSEEDFWTEKPTPTDPSQSLGWEFVY